MILDSNKISKEITNDLKKEIEETQLTPTLATIRIGEDKGSISYEKSIIKNLEPLGITVLNNVLEENATESELIDLIDKLNKDENVNAILLFKPIPKDFDEQKIISTISPEKDVDAVHPLNLGKVMIDDTSGFIPCTAEGVVELLDYYDIDIKGKDITIINNSDIIGKPLSMLLTNKFGTVSVCHEFTKDLKKYTEDADIIITGVGKHGLIRPDMVNEKATVIDVAVAIEKDKDNKIRRTGDILEEVGQKVQNVTSLTPSCGTGTGPLTTALLARNIVKAAKKQKG